MIEQGKSNRTAFMFVLVIFIFCALWAYQDFVNQTPEPPVTTELHPGYHILPKWPFIIHIPAKHLNPTTVYKVTEYRWCYVVEKLNTVVVPQGHVGVIVQDKHIHDEWLEPGKYYFNLDLYEVRIINTQPVEFQFKGVISGEE